VVGVGLEDDDVAVAVNVGVEELTGELVAGCEALASGTDTNG
jgi:hypothetical protein